MQGDGSSLVVASNVMIIDNFLYLPFHGSLSHKTVCLYSHNLPDMFVMIFMEFTEEKAMVSLLFIQYTKCNKPRSAGYYPAQRGTSPLSAGAGQIVSQLGLGLQPSGDSAASYLNFYVATIPNLAYCKCCLAIFRAYSRGKNYG